jgi:hypothetical protein
VRLITAHRILIGAAIAFFLIYAVVQLVRGWLLRGDGGAAVQVVVSVAVALALARYYWTLARKYPALARKPPPPSRSWNAPS